MRRTLAPGLADDQDMAVMDTVLVKFREKLFQLFAYLGT